MNRSFYYDRSQSTQQKLYFKKLQYIAVLYAFSEQIISGVILLTTFANNIRVAYERRVDVKSTVYV
jgi:hypothetical protein